MTRTKACPTCGADFSYAIGKGNDRKHCSSTCRARHKRARLAERRAVAPQCVVPGCEVVATRKASGMCETHYYRERRTGSTDGREVVGRYLTGAGYIKLLRPEHPLADSAGHVFEHRHVAHDTAGGVCPCCHWCGVELGWDAAVVDHLNESKTDNSPGNLVVTCNNCNRARGAMLPLVSRLRPEVLDQFVQLIREHHARG